MQNLALFGLLVIFLVMVQYRSGKTVDEIIERYIRSMGGKAKINSLQSLILKGSFNLNGQPVALTTTRMGATGIRHDLEIGGMMNSTVITPQGGWTNMPALGQYETQSIPKNQLAILQEDLYLEHALVDYHEKGSKAELKGKVTIEGIDCYLIRLTFQNGWASQYYIDRDDYKIIRISSIRNVDGAEKEIVRNYGRYRKNEAGYWLPYRCSNMQGEITWDSIQTNADIVPGVFDSAKMG